MTIYKLRIVDTLTNEELATEWFMGSRNAADNRLSELWNAHSFCVLDSKRRYRATLRDQYSPKILTKIG